MTNPNPTSTGVGGSRRVRANGDGTVYQRKDGRWEAAGYVLAAGDTRKRIHVYGTTRKDALAQLTEKAATGNRGIPAPTPRAAWQPSSPTGWRASPSTDSARIPTPATPPASASTSSPAWGRRSSQSSPPGTSAPGSTSSAPPASVARAVWMPPATSPGAARPGRAAASGCPR